MSTASHFVLVLLCLSFYSCKARSLGVAAAKEVEVSTSKKHDEKLNHPERVPSTKSSSVQVVRFEEAAKEEGRSEEKKKIQDPIADHDDADTSGNDQVEVSSSAASSKTDHESSRESNSSVSWKVPHEKRAGDEPGFNLDYLPPRTHPPAHN